MKMTFLEWAIERDELKEAAKHAYGRDIAVPADPKQGDIIITNAKSFMKSLITPARGELKNGGKSSIGKAGVSKATISGFSKLNQPIVQSTSFDKGAYPIEPENLLDVTPAFEKHPDLETSQSVFIYNRPRSKKYSAQGDVKAMWERWWQQISRPQAAKSKEDLQDIAVQGQFLGNTEKVKQGQRKLGDAEKHQQAKDVTQMIQGLLSGNPVGGMNYDQVLQIMKGMVEDPYDVKFLRKNGYDNIVDTLHDTGLSNFVAGEEHGRIEIRSKPVSPEREKWDAFYNEPQQRTSNPAIVPQVSPEEKLSTWLKTACYDPSIISHTRHWKRHNDTKRYAYFID